MSDKDLTIANAIRQAPNPRVAAAIENAAARSAQRDSGGKLSLKENGQLQGLKRQMTEAALDRQAVAKQGGPRAVAQKERAQSLLGANIHRSGK